MNAKHTTLPFYWFEIGVNIGSKDLYLLPLATFSYIVVHVV